MKDKVPHIVLEVGFDFDWEPQKVWLLDEPVTEMPLQNLVWHFGIPFLWEGDKVVTPQAIMDAPNKHPKEYKRTLAADISHPIDIMQNKGRWLILDGLHRLMKLYMQGVQNVRVRIIPRERIPEITR